MLFFALLNLALSENFRVRSILRSARHLENCQKPAGENLQAHIFIHIGTDMGAFEPARERSAEIIQYANSLLEPDLGYTLAVKEYAAYDTTGCQFNRLGEILNKVVNDPNVNKNVGFFNHVFTACNFESSNSKTWVLGSAIDGNTCMQLACFSVSNIKAAFGVPRELAKTFVHEISHNLGVKHNDSPGYTGWMTSGRDSNTTEKIDQRGKCQSYKRITQILQEGSPAFTIVGSPGRGGEGSPSSPTPTKDSNAGGGGSPSSQTPTKDSNAGEDVEMERPPLDGQGDGNTSDVPGSSGGGVKPPLNNPHGDCQGYCKYMDSKEDHIKGPGCADWCGKSGDCKCHSYTDICRLYKDCNK